MLGLFFPSGQAPRPIPTSGLMMSLDLSQRLGSSQAMIVLNPAAPTFFREP